MRIPSAYIPVSPQTTGLQSGTAALNRSRVQQAQASDSYRKNSGPQVIEAEYVEFYQPAATDFIRERQNLDNRLEPELGEQRQAMHSNKRTDSALNNYQRKTADHPPPGSHLNIFA